MRAAIPEEIGTVPPGRGTLPKGDGVLVLLKRYKLGGGISGPVIMVGCSTRAQLAFHRQNIGQMILFKLFGKNWLGVMD